MEQKLVFLFPGQGSQRIQMGLDLYKMDSRLRNEYFDRANDLLGFSLTDHMFFGTEEDLRSTDIAQPAIYVVSMSLLSLLAREGIKCDLVAGHSLGEFTAVAAADGFSFEDGLQIVAKRGQLMHEVQKHRPGAMCAILGLGAKEVEYICEKVATYGLVVPANYNSPQQLVLSGDEPAIERAMDLAKKMNAEKVVRLSVGAAFHSPLMKEIMEPLRESIAKTSIRDLSVPLVANVDAQKIQHNSEVCAELVQQTVSAVRWTDMVLQIGCENTHFVEIGPGRVLSALVRGIFPDATVSNIDSLKKMEGFLNKYRKKVLL